MNWCRSTSSTVSSPDSTPVSTASSSAETQKRVFGGRHFAQSEAGARRTNAAAQGFFSATTSSAKTSTHIFPSSSPFDRCFVEACGVSSAHITPHSTTSSSTTPSASFERNFPEPQRLSFPAGSTSSPLSAHER